MLGVVMLLTLKRMVAADGRGRDSASMMLIVFCSTGQKDRSQDRHYVVEQNARRPRLYEVNELCGAYGN